MSKFRLLATVSAICAILAVLCCGRQPSHGDSPRPDAVARPESIKPSINPGVVGALDLHARDLYRLLARSDGNLLFSPTGIATALGLVAAGARGATAAECAAVLHQPEPDHAGIGGALRRYARAENYEVLSATGLWPAISTRLSSDFLRIAHDNYGAETRPVDFTRPIDAAAIMNAWVAKQTHGRISRAVQAEALSEQIPFALCNTVYFRAKWQNGFRVAKTAQADFRAPNRLCRVAMMQGTETRPYHATASAHVVELAYMGGEIGLLLIVPFADDGLLDVERDVVAHGLGPYIAGLKSRKVQLSLPRLTLNGHVSLISVLRALGMNHAFDRNSADFSALGDTGPEGCYISVFEHRCAMELDEQGTVATATTTVLFPLRAAAGPQEAPAVVVADRPFFFAIRDMVNGTVLFLGRVVRPE